MSELSPWHSDWAVVPGEVLVEALEDRGMTQAELARRIARPLKTVSEIATGKAAITAETAIQFERALGISARIWLGLEARYREVQAREREEAHKEDLGRWLQRFPLPYLARKGIVPARGHVLERANQLLAFFAVSSAAGWQQHWGEIAGAYRKSDRSTVTPEAIAVWLRLAELDINGAELPPLDRKALAALVPNLRALSLAPVFAGAVARARELLGQVGVGLVVTDSVPSAPASGAVRWIRSSPWIVLTLRFKTEDQFWYSAFHEIGHVLRTRRGTELLEELAEFRSRDLEEQAADDFASEALVPQVRLADWLSTHEPTASSVRAFASELGIAPGLVVGRLQHAGLIGWSLLNFLKRPIGH